MIKCVGLYRSMSCAMIPKIIYFAWIVTGNAVFSRSNPNFLRSYWKRSSAYNGFPKNTPVLPLNGCWGLSLVGILGAAKKPSVRSPRATCENPKNRPENNWYQAKSRSLTIKSIRCIINRPTPGGTSPNRHQCVSFPMAKSLWEGTL